jgi:Holliday junction resolvase RusA-like endonuclease
MIESSKRLRPWRATVTAAIVEAGWHLEPVLSGPVAVSLLFTFPRPRAHYGTGGNANRLKETAPEWHDKRPDADKLARAVLDAITESGTIRDDAQVVSLRVRKRYGQPGVRITLGEDL